MSTTQNPDQHAEANREYFNKIAAEYDARPHAMERVKMSTDAILKIGTWDKESTSLLEYACGTGKLSC